MTRLVARLGLLKIAEILFGVETEYAVSGISPIGAMSREEILNQLMEVAGEQLVHLRDLRGTGGFFLQNGSRIYVDCGQHPEICTPECDNPWEAVRYIEAGHRILNSLAASVETMHEPGAEIMCFRCNVDYSGSKTTWGCHESYMHRIAQDELQPQIVPHLVTRLIYTGAGGFNPLSRGLEFTLSPRMAHFRRVVTENSTSDRGIWHTKSEPLCSGHSRLHVLCGESLCSETANFLKTGVTALIVALADAGFAPGSEVQLADPLFAMQTVAADVTCKQQLVLSGGGSMTAVQIQRHYLEQAEAHLFDGSLPTWAAEVCHRWRTTLDLLQDAPGAVGQSLDWGIKLALFANHARSLGIPWDALPLCNQTIDQLTKDLGGRDGRGRAMPVELAIAPKRRRLKEVSSFDRRLRSQGLQWDQLRALLSCRKKFFEIDTRFGQLGPRGIFCALDCAGVLNHHVDGVGPVEDAVTHPPAKGRAQVRGQAIRRLAGTSDAKCDWQRIVNYSAGQMMDLSDPFTSEESWEPMEHWDFRHPRPWFEEFSGESDSQNPYLRRQDAADRIIGGDYAGAETILLGLLAERFMLPSSHCHMARVLLMTDREVEAREQIAQAWAIRAEAPAYVVARILFFQCVFDLFDNVDIGTTLATLKTSLSAPDAHLDWTIWPMLDHLRTRFGDANYWFLKALANALSDEGAMPNLSDFSQWTDAAVTPDYSQTMLPF
jgi:proteasome accessory factor A